MCLPFSTAWGVTPILRKWHAQWKADAEHDKLVKQQALQDAEDHFQKMCVALAIKNNQQAECTTESNRRIKQARADLVSTHVVISHQRNVCFQMY